MKKKTFKDIRIWDKVYNNPVQINNRITINKKIKRMHPNTLYMMHGRILIL